MKIYISLALIVWVFGGIVMAAEPSKATLLLKNGVVITMEKDRVDQAIAIQANTILWSGKNSAADKYRGPQTKVIDLNGAYVYPGFIDSHAHVIGLGQSRMEMDLRGASDMSSVLSRVRRWIAQSKEGDWVYGRGWDQNLWPGKKFPTAAELDPETPKNPTVLTRVDGHAYWVNSMALQLAGITRDTKDPQGGKIVRDENGNPTGVLVDNAEDLIDAKIPSFTREQVKARIRAALQEAASKGITMIGDPGESVSDIEVFKSLATTDQLPVRVNGMISMPDSASEEFIKKGPQTYNTFYRVRAIKMYMDGALGSRGAALLEPYSDDPGNIGLLRMTQEQLLPLLQLAKQNGFQVGIHAIGDRANRLVLDGYEKTGVQGLRWRIEHAQVISPQDIPRFGTLEVIASMQPTHATSDMPWATDRLGPDRVKGAYAWKSLLGNKVTIAGGSDAPVEDINPLWGIYAASTRQDQNGNPPNGWHPEQIVLRLDAIRMFTINGAYAAFRENELGTIKEGKLADLVVVPKNLVTCDRKDLLNMKILYTISGGIVRYQSAP